MVSVPLVDLVLLACDLPSTGGVGLDPDQESGYVTAEGSLTEKNSRIPYLESLSGAGWSFPYFSDCILLQKKLLVMQQIMSMSAFMHKGRLLYKSRQFSGGSCESKSYHRSSRGTI
jgi:hypothetical protein